MATSLGELLNNLGIEEQDPGTEEAEQLQQLMDGEEKLASQGDEQMGLADLYVQLVASDEEEFLVDDVELDKLAAAEAGEEMGIEKLAAEYDAAGRIMARGFYDEFMKIADGLVEEPSHASTPAMGERGLEMHLPVNKDPNASSQPNPHVGKEEHKEILKGKGEGPGGDAQGAMGAQFATARDIVPTPPQTNK